MQTNKTIFRQVSDRYYKGEDGRAMRLNEETKVWALLGVAGDVIDTNSSKYELALFNGIQLKA